MTDSIYLDPINNEIKVPEWAKDETLSEISTNIKSMKIALDKIAGIEKKQEDIVTSLKNENKKQTKIIEETFSSEEEQRVKFLEKFKEDFRKGWDRNLRQKELYDRNFAEMLGDKLSNIFQTSFDDILGRIPNVGSEFLSGDFVRFGTAVGDVVGLGGAAGLAAGLIEEYANSLVNLIDVGAGAGKSLLDLKDYATSAGIDLESYTKLITENSIALAALGGNVNDGMKAFSDLSNTLRKSEDSFRQFGLSNTEYNEILLQEVELRRKSGMQEQEIADSVSGSMNELLFQTTMLANIQGDSRRELLRARQEQLSDAVVSNFVGTLTEEQKKSFETITRFAADRFGGAGKMIVNGFMRAASSGLDFESVPGIAQFLSLSGPLGDSVRNLFNDFDQVYKTSDPTEAFAFLQERIGQLPDLTEEQRTMLSTVATVGGANSDLAIQILEFSRGINGIKKLTEDELLVEMKKYTQALKDTPMLELASSFEEAILMVKNSLLSTFFAALGVGDELTGKERQDAIEQAIIDGLDTITSTFEDKNLFELFAEIPTGLIALSGALAAATLALKVFAGALFIKGIMGGATGLGAAAAGGAAAGGAAAGGAAAGGTAMGKFFKKIVDIVKFGAKTGPLALTAVVTPTELSNAEMTPEDYDYRMKLAENINNVNLMDNNGNVTLPKITDSFVEPQSQNTNISKPNEDNAAGIRNISPFNENGDMKDINILMQELIREVRKIPSAIENQ